MHQPLDRRSRLGANKPQPARFARLSARDSNTAELLEGCPVVTAYGEQVGTVDHLMIDVESQQLRYVMLQQPDNGALIAIPWHALYFDAALEHLVFFSCAESPLR
jgi:hypothetical protein